jgi:hypothetical protein
MMSTHLENRQAALVEIIANYPRDRERAVETLLAEFKRPERFALNAVMKYSPPHADHAAMLFLERDAAEKRLEPRRFDTLFAHVSNTDRRRTAGYSLLAQGDAGASLSWLEAAENVPELRSQAIEKVIATRPRQRVELSYLSKWLADGELREEWQHYLEDETATLNVDIPGACLLALQHSNTLPVQCLAWETLVPSEPRNDQLFELIAKPAVAVMVWEQMVKNGLSWDDLAYVMRHSILLRPKAQGLARELHPDNQRKLMRNLLSPSNSVEIRRWASRRLLDLEPTLTDLAGIVETMEDFRPEASERILTGNYSAAS